MYVACVAGVFVRFRSKERGTRVKDRAKNGSLLISRAAKTYNSVPRSFFAPKRNGHACYTGSDVCLSEDVQNRNPMFISPIGIVLLLKK